jgi:cyclohexanecarboxylate-CoA ligase
MERITQTVHTSPQQTAIIDLSEGDSIVLTYGELDQLATHIAGSLLDRGIHSGDVIAYQLPSGWEFIALTLGLWKIGATPCPLLPSLREREVRFILRASEAKLLIVPNRFRDFDYTAMADEVRFDAPLLEEVIVVESNVRDPNRSTLGGLLDGARHEVSLTQFAPGPDTVAQLLFTSGTTGEPKGVLHTHQTLSEALYAHTKTLQLTKQDVIWAPSPLAHQTGFLYGMMVSFYLGATGVYQAIWNVNDARRAIVDHGATFVQAALPFLADLTRLDHPPVGLRLFIATGSAIPRPLAKEARDKLQCAVVGAWGSTEACLVSVGRPTDAGDKLWGTDGRVIDGMQFRVVDDEGHELPPGAEGNYQVKTRAMFVGYLHHPEWYETGFTPEGFFDTGDLATIDENGYLRLTGRKKDVVNRGGEKVPVVEIEDILYAHPQVKDVAIVSMPDGRLGERACSFVVTHTPETQLSLEDVKAFLADQGVAKVYWPERLERLESLPRTASGKVQKYKLRELVSDGVNRQTSR